MNVSNWGMFLLGIYLVIVGLNTVGLLFTLGHINGYIALVAGVLILMEHWRRR